MNEDSANNPYPTLAGDDWFIRESIKEELSNKLPAIAAFLISNNIDYEEDIAGMTSAVETHLDAVTGFTYEELQYVITNIQIFTAIRELQEDGMIEMTEDGKYRVAE